MLAIETRHDLTREFLKCVADRAYFIDTHCAIKATPDEPEGAARSAWVPFRLWPAQRTVVAAVDSGAHLVILKSRQLGLTWLLLACILWQMLFRPACTVLLFSRRENEAADLLQRLKDLYAHLPAWLQSTAGGVPMGNTEIWRLGNGSEARAFATTAGDSYTAQIALCDEFDLVDNQDKLLEAVGPTVIESGQLILLSRVDKDKPLSAFKRLYRQIRQHTLTGWRAIFLPWQARPDRDVAWYAARVAESQARTGGLDAVWEQYPATDMEALATRAQGQRIPPHWLTAMYTAQAPGDPSDYPDAPPLPGLRIYSAPIGGQRYVIGADPAEGNPTSDDSAASVRAVATGEQVAILIGKFEPVEFAGYLAQLARYYGPWDRGPVRTPAGVLPERNNHGHLVIAALRAERIPVLAGRDGKAGWLSNAPGKVALYDAAADAFRSKDAPFHDAVTFTQLNSIQGATLRAPDGQPDDLATADALALAARSAPGPATDAEMADLRRLWPGAA